jgi:bacteriorhodopsin
VHKTAGEDLFTKGRLAYDYIKGEAVDGEIADIAAHLAQSTPEFLTPHDFVGVTFWIISMAMVASSVFFIAEASNLRGHWKTSLNVGTLVTLIAAWHYFYMRSYWVTYHTAPTLYRYIDWSLTVPLQMIEFYLILKSVGATPSGIFWRLLVGTVIMLAAGYLGESGGIPALYGFIVGMLGWLFILAEIFIGEAGSLKASSAPPAVQSAFNAMRLIVSVGWSIYPLGYYFGYLQGAVSAQLLNLIYNLADFVNKIAFVLVIWNAACGERDAAEAE